MSKKSENYLDLIFQRNGSLKFEENSDGAITIFVENKGFFNRMAQRFFAKPKVSQIHLEEFGSYIWKLLDGNLSVLQISEKVHERFQEKADPLLPRLVQYFKILENNSFVERKKI